MTMLDHIYTNQYSYGTKIQTPFGERFITYADFIASGQVLQSFETFLAEYVYPTYANTHTEASFTGRQTTHFREEARQMIKDSLNASEEDALIFCGSGSTGAINKLYLKLLQCQLGSDRPTAVFIGPYEHHSNVLPWREGPFELVEVPMASNGGIDLDILGIELEKRKNTHHLIGSFSAASNVTGVLSPVDQINRLLKEYNALTFWDYAGGAPYMHIDMNPGGLLNKDAIFLSPHKLIGGPGTPGILVVKKSLFKESKPVIPGGGTVQFVSKWSHGYIDDIEAREEGGTPDILGSIRAGLAFKLKDDIGAKNIESIEHELIKNAIQRLSENPNILILGSLSLPRLSFLSFHIKCGTKILHHNFVVALLNDLFGIQARGGCSCAGPYGHDLLSIDESTSNCYLDLIKLGEEGFKPGWTRINLNYFLPKDEIEFLLRAIEWIANHGYRLLALYKFESDSGLWKFINSPEPELKSLQDFRINTSYKFEQKEKSIEECMRYIDLANQALSTLEFKKLTTIKEIYTETEEKLRWFALSQDFQDEITI